jgi:hypothetical protein
MKNNKNYFSLLQKLEKKPAVDLDFSLGKLNYQLGALIAKD